MKLFDAQTYLHRRSALAQAVGRGLIWLPGNRDSPKNYKDNYYHFRQDSHFLYYGGISRPDCALLIDAEENKTYLCGDDADLEDIIWTGPQATLSDLAAAIGAQGTLTLAALEERVQDAQAKARPIHFLPPYRADNQIWLSSVLGLRVNQVPANASAALISAIMRQRSVKEAQELAQIEEALAITKEMHLQVMYGARPGLRESDMVAKLLEVAHRANVDTAYPVILTVNGETLHNHHHHQVMQAGQLLLGDFGAESPMYYASDITRTLPVSSSFTTAQKDIYQLVLDAMETAIHALRPGVTYRDVHLSAARTMTAGLKDLGLMSGDVEEAVAAGAHALFFPHGLGHMLGLDVHEMEDLGEDLVGYDQDTTRSPQFGLRALRLGKTLESGYVLTVEPGLYFIPALIDQWQASRHLAQFINYSALAPFRDLGGIRIEDNYVITDEGADLLGPAIPKTVAEIEFLRSIDSYVSSE